METAELLGSPALASYVTRGTRLPFIHFVPLSHLVSLANALDASPLVPQEHAEQFREGVADVIHTELLESAEGRRLVPVHRAESPTARDTVRGGP